MRVLFLSWVMWRNMLWIFKSFGVVSKLATEKFSTASAPNLMLYSIFTWVHHYIKEIIVNILHSIYTAL